MPQQQPQQGFKPCTKRPRSPSPPPSIPVSLYHQGYSSYKPSVGSTPYQSSPQSKWCLMNPLGNFFGSLLLHKNILLSSVSFQISVIINIHQCQKDYQMFKLLIQQCLNITFWYFFYTCKA